MAAAGNSNAGVVARHFRCPSRNSVTQLSSSLPSPPSHCQAARSPPPRPLYSPVRPHDVHDAHDTYTDGRHPAPDARAAYILRLTHLIDSTWTAHSAAPLRKLHPRESRLRAGSTPTRTRTPHVVWSSECRRPQNHCRPFRLRPRLRIRTTLRKRGMMIRRTSRRALGRRHI